MKKSWLVAIAILAIFGLARMGFEQDLTDQHRRAYFHGAKYSLSMWQQIGQTAFVAALSGFRSVVADWLWIQAHVEWEKTNYGRMAALFQTVTALQPRNTMFWDIAAWHLGYNASRDAIDNVKKQPRAALRVKAQRDYFKMAEDFLKRGIENNPDKYDLYEKLGTLYRDKFGDHWQAYQSFDKAAQFKRAPTYEKRFAAYELAKVPGKEQEAYDRLVALYKLGEREHLPTLLSTLKSLEDQLNIPPEQRIYNPDKK